MAVADYLQTFFESIKKMWNEFSLKQWSESIGGSSSEAVEAAVYFGLSFSIGFLFKKYFKYIFISLLLTLFLVKACEYAKVLTIDWQALYTALGFAPDVDFAMLSNRCFDWMKDHLLLFISAIVGFLVGYKLG